MLGIPATGLSEPVIAQWLVAAEPWSLLFAHLPQLATTSFVIAVIGSLDSLLAAVAMDTTLHTRHDANRMLIGQGLANIAVGAVGGVPVALFADNRDVDASSRRTRQPGRVHDDRSRCC